MSKKTAEIILRSIGRLAEIGKEFAKKPFLVYSDLKGMDFSGVISPENELHHKIKDEIERLILEDPKLSHPEKKVRVSVLREKSILDVLDVWYGLFESIPDTSPNSTDVAVPAGPKSDKILDSVPGQIELARDYLAGLDDEAYFSYLSSLPYSLRCFELLYLNDMIYAVIFKPKEPAYKVAYFRILYEAEKGTVPIPSNITKDMIPQLMGELEEDLSKILEKDFQRLANIHNQSLANVKQDFFVTILENFREEKIKRYYKTTPWLKPAWALYQLIKRKTQIKTIAEQRSRPITVANLEQIEEIQEKKRKGKRVEAEVNRLEDGTVEIDGRKYFMVEKAAKKLGYSVKTLRNWDKEGILKPKRLRGFRVYSQQDIEYLRKIKGRGNTEGFQPAGGVIKLIANFKKVKPESIKRQLIRFEKKGLLSPTKQLGKKFYSNQEIKKTFKLFKIPESQILETLKQLARKKKTADDKRLKKEMEFQ